MTLQEQILIHLQQEQAKEIHDYYHGIKASGGIFTGPSGTVHFKVPEGQERNYQEKFDYQKTVLHNFDTTSSTSDLNNKRQHVFDEMTNFAQASSQDFKYSASMFKTNGKITELVLQPDGTYAAAD